MRFFHFETATRRSRVVMTLFKRVLAVPVRIENPLSSTSSDDTTFSVRCRIAQRIGYVELGVLKSEMDILQVEVSPRKATLTLRNGDGLEVKVSRWK